MIQTIVVTAILRIISIVLQLFFIKKISNGLTIVELGEYYFHLTITFVYQVLFFTPFIQKYQKCFRGVTTHRNVLHYLGDRWTIILVHCGVFLILSSPFFPIHPL